MNRKNYQSLFQNRKVTVMGLGVLGRGLQVTKFLADCGAKLTVTDLKSKKELSTSINALKKYKIKYVLGKHNLKDFKNVDFVVKSAGVPMDSIYINQAKSLNIPIIMDASLFAKIAQKITPKIRIVGITGTRGKSVTTAIIFHILKSNAKKLGVNVHLGGNMRMKATLPILKSLDPGDIVVLELDSWQCQGFGDEKLSPEIAVFTSFMPDHMNYYKNSMDDYLFDKSNIFKFQNRDDILITNKSVLKVLKGKPKSKVVIANKKLASSISMNIFGEHNIQNASYAYAVARIFALSDKEIQKSLKSFPGLEGRLENIRLKNGTTIINDNNATTPQATIAGIKAVKLKYKNSKIILITGGSDKNLDLNELTKTINKYCEKVILLSGTGTEKLKNKIKSYTEYSSLKLAVSEAISSAGKNDIILFSPAFASFGLFIHEYDRNDQFLKIIKKWK